ncbi:hypothetical protein PMAYCL1PPCAC_07356, partial [Pristionchus mayeri]
PLNEESVQEVADEGREVQLTPEQKTAELAKLMAEGKRELKAGNFEGSSQKFGEAAEFAAKHYGDLAEESFEPNFQYGKALVELSIVESDLFKNALVDMVKKGEDETEEKDGDESMTEEEKEDVREMVAEALCENAEELEKKAAEGTEEQAKGDEAEEESKEEKTEEESKSDSKEEKTEAEKESAEETAAGDKEEENDKMEEGAENEEAMNEEDAEKEDIEDGDEEDEEEDLDNNQLAWEALEVASRIADKMIAETSDVTWKRRRADVFVQLAQCAANDEKYEMALEDLGRALDLMTEMETFKEDRLTAEIYFHTGRINRLRNEFTLAEESFNKAVGAFEILLAQKKSEGGENPTDEQKEDMKDLEAVINDFKERAEDCKASEVQKKMMATMVEKEKEENPSILTSSNANSDPTANDISSLVRKKRAHDDSEAEKEVKKAKSEGEEEMRDENVAV